MKWPTTLIQLVYQILNFNNIMKLYSKNGPNMTYILIRRTVLWWEYRTNSMLKLPTIKLSQNLGIEETTYIVAWIASLVWTNLTHLAHTRTQRKMTFVWKKIRLKSLFRCTFLVWKQTSMHPHVARPAWRPPCMCKQSMLHVRASGVVVYDTPL